MKTAFKSPDGDSLQKAGEVCRSCFDFWDDQKLPPQHMVNVYDSEGAIMTTGCRGLEADLEEEGDDEDEVEVFVAYRDTEHTDRHIDVVVCPRCDGELILRLPKE